MKFSKIFFSSLLMFGAVSMAACQKGNKPKEMIDYVAQAKLSTYFDEVDSTNFIDGGVGLVTLWNAVDGDTAHFHQDPASDAKKRLVKVRFYGIDTPESTGQLEPWGKKASKFTTEKLQAATSIVLTKGELDRTAAELDSTGGRYKGLVWVSDVVNPTLDDYRCLNLWIVQEGFSNGKGVANCPLGDLFNKADLQAQEFKLHTWSGKDPDFYDGDAMATSIHEIMHEFVDKKGSCPTYEGKKVSISGVVGKVVDTDAYVVEDYEDEETGEVTRYGMYIFSGYKWYEPLTTVGTDLTIIGIFTVRYGNPQITSVAYNKYLPGKDDMIINREGVEVPYDVKTFADVDGKYDFVNMINVFEGLKATGKGKNVIDAQTAEPNGALNIELQDTQGNKMYLRVPKNVKFLKHDPENSGDWVKDYDYLYKNNLTINLTAAIAIYDPSSGEEGEEPNPYWQLTLCAKEDIVYVD